MTDPEDDPGVLGPRLRAVIALGLAGLLAGFLWGIADVPRYTSSAAVIVNAKGGGEVDAAELARVASLGESEKVATKAAGVLGDDVAGGDLLSDVTVVPAPASGGVVVSATADAPDIAAATADGYAQGLVEVGDDLDLGTAATVPGSPSENRSAVLWSALGLLAGLIAGGAAVALLARRPRAERAEEPAPAPRQPTAPAAPPLEEAFGVGVIAARPAPTAIVARSGRVLELGPEGLEAMDELLDELGIDEEGAPARLAVLEARAGDGADEVMVGLAVAAADLGLTVIAVEADLADPTLAEITGVAPAPGLGDYLAGEAGPRDVLRPVALRGEPPLVCLPAGEVTGDPSAPLRGGRLAGLLDRLPRVYDLVLVSGPPLADEQGAAALADRVDGVVLVAADADGAADAVAAAAGRIGPRSLVAGVVTAAGSAQSRPQSALPRA